MNEVTITVTSSGVCPDIQLGRQGENLATKITFDCAYIAVKYGSGTAQVLHQRNGDDSPYPCAVTQEDSTVTWAVSNADTAKTGRGKLELCWYVGDTLAKSVIYSTRTLPALASDLADPPEAYQNWIDKLLDDVEDIVSGGSGGSGTSYTETDPTVPDWAKAATKPTYTAAEVGALPASTDALKNPYSLTLTGAVSAEYDGSEAVEVEIPTTKGEKGEQGEAGTDGKDGVSCTHSWDGTTLTVTSASGTSSADLKGEKGDAGEQGEAGTDGKDGADGTSATIVVGTVTTGEPGTDASVVNSGTQNAAVLDFVIPRGDSGSTGLPTVTTDDAGKILVVSSSGEWEATSIGNL